MPTAEERAQWRENNADLIEFIQTPANQMSSNVLQTMALFFDLRNSLTPAQTVSVRRIMSEMRSEADVERAAEAHEAEMIPNGTFTIEVGGLQSTFRIHTVRNGRLTGKRVVKRQEEYGGFKAFAFVTPEGSLKVWRSYYEEEAAGSPSIRHARTLLGMLCLYATEQMQVIAQSNSDEFEIVDILTGATMQAAILCRICNRQLNHPDSIRRGIGPDCWEMLHPVEEVQATADTITGTPAPMASESELPDTAESLELARLVANRANPYGLTPCPYCHRNNFMQPQGRGRHIASCRRTHNGVTLVTRLEAMFNAPDVQRTSTQRPARRTLNNIPRSRFASSTPPPVVHINPSQLGTVVNGEVWPQ